MTRTTGISLFGDRPLGLAAASVRDHRELARRRLPRQLFDYIDGGAYEEATMRANESQLRSIRLRQRVMRDVSELNTSTEVFGSQLRVPVALGPVGLGGMFARRAEVQAAQAAEAFGVPFCESTVSICSMEEVARETSRPFWYQLYVMKDRSFAEDLMARAAAVGCELLVLTVDFPVVGERYRDARNGMTVPVGPAGRIARAVDLGRHVGWVRDVGLGGRPLTFGNLEDAVPGASSPEDFKGWVDSQFDASVSWDDLAWVRQHWDGPVVIKGVLDPEDAATAVGIGVDGVVVSNHGGRQLDDTVSTIEALPAVVDAVGDDATVLFDGGIRSGLDVLKALALGAQAVLLGRAWAWAVAGGGREGVAHVLDTIEAELRVAMALCGATDVNSLDPSILVER